MPTLLPRRGRYLVLPLLLSAAAGRAQQPTAAPTPPTAPVAAGLLAIDVLVRTSGAELPVRVVSVSPKQVRYLPPVPNLPGAAPADTLTMPAAEFRLIRYANGTQQRIPPADGAPAPIATLVGLNTEQRYEQGRRDSRRFYKPAPGVFWGTLAGTAATGYGGLAVGTAAALSSPSRQKLNLTAPTPALLDDPAYLKGYIKQAKNRKLGRAAAGFGIGAVVAISVTSVLVLSIFGLK